MNNFLKGTLFERFVDFFLIFLFLLGTFFFVRSYLHGEEVFFDSQSEQRYIQRILDIQCGLNPEDRKFYQEKIEFHKANGERCWYAAKEKCWWLPDLSDREKARHCYTSVMSTMASTTLTGKLAAAVLTALTQYGLDVVEEWFYIQNKLHYAKYHLEMAEFYADVIAKDGDTGKKKKKKK